MTDLRTFTVSDEDDGIRLDRWFKRHLPDVTFNMVSRWARTGQVRVAGKPVEQAIHVLRGLGPALGRQARRLVENEGVRVLVDDHVADQSRFVLG